MLDRVRHLPPLNRTWFAIYVVVCLVMYTRVSWPVLEFVHGVMPSGALGIAMLYSFIWPMWICISVIRRVIDAGLSDRIVVLSLVPPVALILSKIFLLIAWMMATSSEFGTGAILWITVVEGIGTLALTILSLPLLFYPSRPHKHGVAQ